VEQDDWHESLEGTKFRIVRPTEDDLPTVPKGLPIPPALPGPPARMPPPAGAQLELWLVLVALVIGTMIGLQLRAQHWWPQ